MTYLMTEYDETLEKILRMGTLKQNRTGIPARTIFGLMCRYDISEKFPLLTRRRVWPRAIWAELLWFLKGSTNVFALERLGSKIWSPWRSEEFEKKQGYIEGALGPIYGFQLRHFGGDYFSGQENERDYGYWGFDQLKEMVRKLKEDPDSRSNLFSLWDPQAVNGQRLPCCHFAFQVHVDGDRLSGMLTQRSADFPVGVPANIQFYSTLLIMLGQQANLRPGELIHSMGSAHIYENQVEAVEEYLSRPTKPSPTLKVTPADIESYNTQSFQMNDYRPLGPIKIPVAV